MAQKEKLKSGISCFKIGAHSIIDTTGIPLSSDRGPSNLVKGIDWQYQACPFRDSSSRYPNGQPHPTHMSGLERQRLASHYPQIIEGMHSLRSAFTESTRSSDLDTTQPLNTGEMRTLLRAMVYLPGYLTQRAINPVNIHGGLPPEFIVLSNSSSGTLGALEGFLELGGNSRADLKKVPDPESMLKAIERVGSMVGPKTICVAAPEQMRHFFHCVINGAPQYRNRFDITTWINLNKELVSILMYGENAYLTKNMLEDLYILDSLIFAEIKPYIEKGRNFRHYRSRVEDFMRQADQVLSELKVRQEIVNAALNRGAGPELSVAELGNHHFRLPKIAQANNLTRPKKSYFPATFVVTNLS